MTTQTQMVRISASQNTFLFIDATVSSPVIISEIMGFSSIEDFVRYWTMGENGLSADGMVFVSRGENSGSDFRWHFYNCDGSSAEMCGNASRALSTFVNQYLGFSKNIMTFESLAGLVTAERINGDRIIKIAMPHWKIIEPTISIDIENFKKCGILLNTGVPHCVVEVDDLNNSDQNFRIARGLRYLPEAGSRGTNVSLFQRRGICQIAAKTFERGVENFTRSCGTGVIASAIAYINSYPEECKLHKTEVQSIEVDVPGGHLKALIHFDKKMAYLIGDSRVDFEVRANRKVRVNS